MQILLHLHYFLVLHFALKVLTFCVTNTFCGVTVVLPGGVNSKPFVTVGAALGQAKVSCSVALKVVIRDCVTCALFSALLRMTFRIPNGMCRLLFLFNW